MAKLPKLSYNQQFVVSFFILIIILLYVAVTFMGKIESQASTQTPSPTPTIRRDDTQRIRLQLREQIRNLVGKIFYQRSRTPYRQIAPVVTGLPTPLPTPAP